MKWIKKIQRTKFQSFFVLLPKAFLDMNNWKKGDSLEIEAMADGSMKIRKL
jgi:antitoxin component of MazEF toxin-antitoxin module